MNIKLSKAKEIALVVILILIAINLTVSYSYFSVNTTHDNTLSTISGHVNCLDITYEEQNSLNLSGQYPVSDEWALANMTPVTITVENNCENTDERLNYTLALSTLRNATGFINDNQIRMHLKRTMYGDTEKIFKNTDYVSNLSQVAAGNALDFITQDLQTRGITSSYTTITNYVLDSTDIGAGETNTYRLYLWIDYYEGDTTHAGLNDNTTQNKQYKTALSLVLNADDNVEEGFDSAFDKLTTLASGVTKYTGKVTDHPSQIGEGVDATKVYAFTSNTNNNLVFANHCWQIRRTTETGGIKIQYNGEPTLGSSNGKITYDCGTTRPYHIGENKTTQNLNGTKTYGDNYTYSVSGNTTTFTLTNTTSITINSSNASTIIPTLKGKYICGSGTSSTCTNENLKKIDEQSSGTTAYVYAATYRDSLGTGEINTTIHYAGTSSYTLENFGYMSSTDIRLYYSRNVINIGFDYGDTLYYGAFNQDAPSGVYYSDSYTKSGNYYTLTYPTQATDLDDYPEKLIGKYVVSSYGFFSISDASSYTDRYVLYILDAYADGEEIIISATIDGDESEKYLVGDNLVYNNVVSLDGNVREFYVKELYNISNYEGKIICINYTYDSSNNSNTCSSAGYITWQNGLGFNYNPIYKYGYDVVKVGNEYELVDKNGEEGTLQFIYDWNNANVSNCFNNNSIVSNCGYQSLSKSHYTCLNLTGKCSTYNYVVYTSTSGNNDSLIYLQLSNGKKINTNLNDTNNLLYELVNHENLNSNDSLSKIVIDEWYKSRLLNTNFESLIDRNAVFCHDRRIVSYGAWNPDGGETSGSGAYINFYGYSYSSSNNTLNCYRALDSFSSNNTSASLKYPIALMSKPEMLILNNGSVRSSQFSYWTMTPYYFAKNFFYEYVDSYGQMWGGHALFGFRPAIVLNSNAEFSSGTGSTSDPFIVKGSEMTP